jgi:hypothetical protein
MRSTQLASCFVLFTLTLAFSGAFTVSAGGIISFHVASPASQNYMYSGDYAGAFGARAKNWNDLVADANGSADEISLSAGSVMDSSGNVVVGMKVLLHPSSAGGGVVNYANSGGTNDPKMFLDYDDCFGGNSFANFGYIEVTNIPYASYSIYCYAATDNSPNGSLANARGGFWLITNAPGGPARCYIKDVDNNGNLVPEPDTSGYGYVPSQTTAIPSGSSSWTNVNGGNYVVFDLLLTNSATRIWFGAMGGSGGGVDDLGNTFTDGDTGTLRLKVCGFQIVKSLIGLTATNLYLQSPVPALSPDMNCALTLLADFTDGTMGGNVTTLPETTYASSNTNIFNVDSNGVIITGSSNGVATLTITYQANTLQVLVTNPVAISRVQGMPDIPSPFLMRDWKQTASNYDSFVFNYNLSGNYLPLVVPDNANENFNLPWFALPSYVGFTNYSQPEGINAIAAVLGASLVGIDKSNQNGTNWVLMMSQYCDTAVNVFFNNAFYATSARMDFWYCLLPHILFAGLVDHYPATANEGIPLSHGGGAQTMNGLFYAAATNWYDACLQLGAGPGSAPDFNYLGCSWPGGQPYTGGWVEAEGAAGVAWLEYMAWRDFGDTNFLQAADWGLEFMQNSTSNIIYETLLPYGVLAAARMNAEQGRNYDINKFMNWCFDGNGYARPAWGVMTGQWGGSDVDGLIGSQNDGGGYAFAMNTFEWAGALAPVARYDQRYAHDLGKWLLNLANNARLFYSTYVPADHQSSGWWLNGTNDIISYEGLRASWNGTNLYACGDATGGGDPTDFALYGASHVGLLAAIVGSTSDPMIPQLDLRATDHFLAASYPAYLYYNPHATNASFTVNYGTGTNDLLDIVSEQFLATGATGSVSLTLPPDTAAVIVVLPAGATIGTQGTRMYANGYIIDYRYSGIETGGGGLPDWWKTLYFGNVTNVNPNAIGASGYTYLTCYQLGISPFARNLFNQEIVSFNVCSPQNFSQDYMDAGDYAGAPGVRTNNWNNLVADGSWSSGNITLSSGTVSNSAGNLVPGLSVTFHPAGNGGGVGTYSGGGNNNDTKMFVDYNDAWNCSGFSQYGYLDITGIPFARYQIYCYAATDNSPSGSPSDARGGFFVITNAPGGTNRCYLKDVDSHGNIVPEPNSSGIGYVQSTTTSIPPGGASFTNINGGNYVAFNSTLTNSSTRVWFGALGGGQGVDDLENTITDGNSAARLKVCGFQVVKSVTALTPTRMNASILRGMVQLSWPPDHLGWRLETNAIGLPATNAWFPYPGSDTVTNLSVPLGASGNVFFRLTYP